MREMVSQRLATLDRSYLVDDRIRKTGSKRSGIIKNIGLHQGGGQKIMRSRLKEKQPAEMKERRK